MLSSQEITWVSCLGKFYFGHNLGSNVVSMETVQGDHVTSDVMLQYFEAQIGWK